MATGKKVTDRFYFYEELGRGAYGQVYRGMDSMSGDIVAIKQISLAGVPSDSLQTVMGEIDLLKTLNHKNIVKYIGSFKSRTHLYIILEYMENGSLASVIKPNKFGTFSESLAAVYIAQVLQGLQYLHEQGVVHRDIKGANILTTKDGLVKLADFGVAAKLGELDERKDDLAASVVGTPYWMAPEVIEMTQVTSSSDIWSVGCLIIELLTGYPPYFDLVPMSAMFRIVQDPQPPLPENISPLLRDFLSRCFLKDAKLRPDAGTLLQHEWLQYNRRTLRMSWRRDRGQTFRTLVQNRTAARQSPDAHENISSVVTRMMAAADEEASGADAANVNGLASASTGMLGPLGAGAVALPDGGSRDLSAVGPNSEGRASGNDTSNLAAAPAGEEPTTALLTEAPQYSDSTAAGTGSTLPYAPADPIPVASPRVNGADVSRAAAQQAGGVPQIPAVTSSSAPSSGSAPTSGADAVAAGTLPGPATDAGLSVMEAGTQPGPLIGLIQRLHGTVASDGSATHGKPMPRDLASWMDGGGQSYDTSRQLSRPTGAWPSADLVIAAGYADAQGAWGPLEADTVGSSLTSQATLLRRQVRDLVQKMRPGARQEPLSAREHQTAREGPATSAAKAMKELEQMISAPPPPPISPNGPWLGVGEEASYLPAEVKAIFLNEGGVLIVMEVLDADNQKAVEAVLDLMMALVRDDVRLLESLCLVGLVPTVARYTQQPYPVSLRLKAATFVHALCFQRDSTLQLFIAAGGLRQLCWMVADSVASEPSPLSHVAIQCLLQVLQCYATLPLNYICRILAQCGLVPRLYKLLKEAIAVRNKMPHHQRPANSATNGAGSSAASGAVAAPPADGAAAHAAAGAHHVRSISTAPLLSNGPVRGAATAGGVPGTAVGGGAASTVHRAATAPVLSGAVPGGLGTPAEARGAGGMSIPGEALTYDQVIYLMDTTVYLLVVLSNADGAVKNAMCTRDNLLQHLDCLRRLQPPHLVEMLRCMRNLTSDPAVLPAIKDAGAIACLVPMLAMTPDGSASVNPGPPTPAATATSVGASATSSGPTAGSTANIMNTAGVLPKSEVQMEALNALYNLCMYNKKVHMEAAASSNIIPHLCSFAAQCWAAVSSTRLQRQASLGGNAAAAGSQTPRLAQTSLQHVDPVSMTPGSPAALAAAAAQWPTVRGFVVPLLLGMVACSATTRLKLFQSHGLEIFLQLLSDEDSRSVLGVLQALDSWLAEDHSRVEARLTQRDATTHLVQLYARSCAAQDMQSKLEALRTMLGRSSKLAVALAMGGLVPWLLAMIQHAAPINRVKILDIVRILYEHYPRPKEFIMMYKIQDVLAMLLKTHGRDADAVIQQAQRLLAAFDINVLL
ncbi:hypothetical protein Vafri_5411 [Volvox africanus]|nr:hypothetical protein Vafri_5411 [Volvox africanus]